MAVSSHPFILLVEDDPAVLHVLSLFLEGHSLLCARSAHEAFTLALKATKPIDLVITDVMLPGMGGSEIAASVERLHRDAKVLFISGYDQEELKGQRLVPEQAMVLKKPFSVAQLSAALNELLLGDGSYSTARV